MSILYRGPSKDASYQVLVHLAKRFQRKIFFRNQPQAILVSDWLISKKISSENAWPNESKLGRKHP
jgi:hypothetical protein